LAGADVPTATILKPKANAPTLKAGPSVAPATQPARPLRWALPALAVVVFVLGAGGAGLWAMGVLDPLLSQFGIGAQPTATATEPIAIVNVPTDTATAQPTAPPTLTEAPSATPTNAPSETPPPTATAPPTAIPLTDTPAPTPIGGGQGQIAFASSRNGLPQIFLMNVDGTNQVQITDVADGACQPAWSPDGTRLLFVSPCTRKQDLYNNAAIYIVNVPADPTGPLSASPFIARVGGNFDPDWSEVGVAFTFTGGDRAQIYVADANGLNAQVLSEPRSADTQPSWSQGGAKLAFRNATRSGRSTIYWMNQDGSFDGSIPTQITRELAPCNGEASAPAWAPDGAFVAYVVNQHICVVAWDAKGFNPKQITNKSPNADPAWSPDSQWIVFESWRDAAKHEIYVMTASGGAVTRLTNNDADEFQPAWRP
jgi:Tol biopolymer transport system component